LGGGLPPPNHNTALTWERQPGTESRVYAYAVLRFALSPEDVLATRFALSPLWEAVMSYRAARCPSSQRLRGSWLEEAVRIGREADAALLDVALGVTPGAHGHLTDFLLPRPQGAVCDFHAELARVRRADPAAVAADVRLIYGDVLPPAALPFVHDPERAIQAVADVVARYWDVVVKPRWPRVHAVLEGDVTFRGRSIALRGPGALFDGLHPDISYRDGALEIDRPYDVQVDAAGRGLLLVPLVFSFPLVVAAPDLPDGPMLGYTPRGAETLWLGERPEGDETLAGLVGHARDTLLRALERPLTTTELAQLLAVTPSAISQRLGDLRRLGLLESQRLGRRVYHRRSARADRLLELFGREPALAAAM
jgi:DNA-binding transcriptional ArsR family regulator